MKNKVKVAVVSLISLCLLGSLLSLLSLKAINSYYDKKINGKYYDAIGNNQLLEKNQGLILQEEALKRGYTLMIYGSSELSSTTIPSHPINFFKDRAADFQVNLVGRGYSQSLVHAINFQALGNSLKGKKVVFIISPQWFTPKGINNEGLAMNFSELQFYKMMFDKTSPKEVKKKVAERLNGIINNTMELGNIKIFSYLYAKDNFVSKAALGLLMPYYKFDYEVLSTKDKIKTYKLLKKFEGRKSEVVSIPQNIDYKVEEEMMTKEAAILTNNNDFGILNNYYTTYIKDKMPVLKDSYKGNSFLKSPEYEDFDILLDTCKNIGVKPLFVSVPVHGKWYDYCGFDKNDRSTYYKNITTKIQSKGYEVVDLSSYENEKYMLNDIMHLGWKGWLLIDEAIVKYYKNN